jgi:hypothetical protein
MYTFLSRTVSIDSAIIKSFLLGMIHFRVVSTARYEFRTSYDILCNVLGD